PVAFPPHPHRSPPLLNPRENPSLPSCTTAASVRAVTGRGEQKWRKDEQLARESVREERDGRRQEARAHAAPPLQAGAREGLEAQPAAPSRRRRWRRSRRARRCARWELLVAASATENPAFEDCYKLHEHAAETPSSHFQDL
ncbi:hypothetical protein ABZP36_035280, partial [Zizania latifolia]